MTLIFTVIAGDPLTGFGCHGLFVDRDDAIRFAEAFITDQDWSIMEIEPAYAEDEKGDNCLVRIAPAAPDLLEMAKRYRHLLSELHGGNTFSKEHLWQALAATNTVFAKAGAA